MAAVQPFSLIPASLTALPANHPNNPYSQTRTDASFVGETQARIYILIDDLTTRALTAWKDELNALAEGRRFDAVRCRVEADSILGYLETPLPVILNWRRCDLRDFVDEMRWNRALSRQAVRNWAAANYEGGFWLWVWDGREWGVWQEFGLAPLPHDLKEKHDEDDMDEGPSSALAY